MSTQAKITCNLPNILICGYERGGTTLLADLFRSNGYESGFECGVLMCDTPKEFLQYEPYVGMLQSGWGISPSDIPKICQADFESFYLQLISKSDSIIKNSVKFFDKTPIYMSKLGQVLHRTNFIKKACVIHRDPRAIFTSWAKRECSDESVEAIVLELLENYCRRYVEYFLGCIAHADNPNVLFVPYEMLCLHEEMYCEKIGMFAEGKNFNPRKNNSRFNNVEGVGMDLNKVFQFENFLSQETQNKILDRTRLAAPFFASKEERNHYGDLWEETCTRSRAVLAKYNLTSISSLVDDVYFEPMTYLVRYSDVLDSQLNPVFHYENHGKFEGRVAS